VDAITARGDELSAVELVSIHTEGAALYLDPRFEGVFHLNIVFVGANTREAVGNGMASYVPVFLSEIPQLFRCGIMPLDVAMVQVSAPDKHGKGIIHVSAIDALVECNQPIFELLATTPSPIDEKIGNFIAGLVEDGATLQTGIGGVPNSALKALRGYRNLGMHSEMFSDGVMELVECGP
jgi:4-hydroxybutyrate CoA-transferase